MKKIKKTLLVCCILAISGIVFFSIDHRKEIVEGNHYEEKSYFNDFFNLHVETPGIFSLQDSDEATLINSQLEQHKMDQIFLFNLETNLHDSIYFTAYATQLTPIELFNPDTYISKKIKDMKMTFLEIELKEGPTEKIDRQDFRVLIWNFGNHKLLDYITFQKGYAIEFLVEAKDQKEIDSYSAVIKAIKF